MNVGWELCVQSGIRYILVVRQLKIEYAPQIIDIDLQRGPSNCNASLRPYTKNCFRSLSFRIFDNMRLIKNNCVLQVRKREKGRNGKSVRFRDRLRKPPRAAGMLLPAL